jgi:hypothetical protein
MYNIIDLTLISIFNIDFENIIDVIITNIMIIRLGVIYFKLYIIFFLSKDVVNKKLTIIVIVDIVI